MTDLRPLLIVEDDELTRAFLLDNLAADGFRVAGAASVGEGLRAIEVRQPALVVLDLGLEGAGESVGTWVATPLGAQGAAQYDRSCGSGAAARGSGNGQLARPG